MDFKNHPVMLNLGVINLEKDKLSWELGDVIDQIIIESVEDFYLSGKNDLPMLQEIMNAINPYFERCIALESRFPENRVIDHNLTILASVRSNLTIGLISHPSRKKVS